jgi:hypothetical protein
LWIKKQKDDRRVYRERLNVKRERGEREKEGRLQKELNFSA